MKIGNQFNVQQVQSVMKSYQKNIQKTDKVNDAKFVTDKIEISDAAREVQVANKAFKNLPEVRDELISQLKQAIADGAYKPSSEDVAKKILGR